MITLKIPKGEYCTGCMFLDKDFFGDALSCMLFKEPLRAKREYGSTCLDKILKCEQCETVEHNSSDE